ncbi:glycoside hydrolase family 3 C-terminal domain-containing protein [Paenibacillus albidus]|nr:glycoside hydrolase family 3 C-terminal domain-containing protein [Paenibacillus albidus]
MSIKNKEYRFTYTEKAQEIIKQLTLEEKVFLMSGSVSMEQFFLDFLVAHYNHVPYPAGGNERLNIPPMKFVDGPRGSVAGNSTCFPVAMGRGASFDPDLEQRIGQAIGKEIKANGGNLFGGVCINLPRHPGWGRSQETYGEESFHLGVMGSALTTGVQSEDVIACIKHYAFNSMENSRFKVNVKADKRTEREVYLSHFKDAIDAGAASVMSAYNLYDGDHCGHSDYLLNQVLKDEWGFDGFVISDFVWGVRDTEKAVNGGMDIEMCNTVHFGDKLVEAVRNGKVSEEKINLSALRIVRTLLAFTENSEKQYSKDIVASDNHIKLALEAAEKSMTLIKNENHVLPFSKNIKKLAVIGKLADKANIGDHGSSRVFPPYVVTPLQGFKQLLPDTDVIYDDGSDLERAAELAKSSDAVVFVVGYDHNDEGEYLADEGGDTSTVEQFMGEIIKKNPELLPKMQEMNEGNSEAGGLGVGGDRTSLYLHEDEIDLLNKVGPVNRNSATVLIGGNTILLNNWKNTVSSILMAYYPGMEGGTAIAKTLFGDVNPGGKLPYVTPVREGDLPTVEWDTEEIIYGYYHGYAKLEKEGVEAELPYGYGLSYTTFAVSNAIFEVENDKIVGTCEVENTGEREGDEVIQLYVGFSNSMVDRPVKVLRGFKRVTLQPGEKREIEISCPIEKIKWYNPQTNNWQLEEMEYEVCLGTSSANRDLLTGVVNVSLQNN